MMSKFLILLNIILVSFCNSYTIFDTKAVPIQNCSSQLEYAQYTYQIKELRKLCNFILEENFFEAQRLLTRLSITDQQLSFYAHQLKSQCDGTYYLEYLGYTSFIVGSLIYLVGVAIDNNVDKKLTSIEEPSRTNREILMRVGKMATWGKRFGIGTIFTGFAQLLGFYTVRYFNRQQSKEIIKTLRDYLDHLEHYYLNPNF